MIWITAARPLLSSWLAEAASAGASVWLGILPSLQIGLHRRRDQFLLPTSGKAAT